MVGAAAFAIPLALLIGIFAELNDQSISRFIDDVTDLTNKQKFAAEATDLYGKEIGDLSAQLLEGTITYKQYKKLTDEIADAQILATAATMENTAENRENVLSLLRTSDAIEQFRISTEDAAIASAVFSGSIEEVVTASTEGLSEDFLSDLDGVVIKFDSAGKAAAKATKTFGAGIPFLDTFGGTLTKAGEEADKTGKKLATLDGKEVKVKVKAETETAVQQLTKFQSVLDSIGDSIANTGTTLTGLGGLLVGQDFGIQNLGSKFAIQDAFKAETEARQKALDQQNDLIETEIKLQQARLKQIETGETKITIDTTGIAPILDLLLTTIIQEAQVRAAANGASFLIGA